MFKYVKVAELPVTDQDRAVRFYTKKLGLSLARDSPYQEGWRWIELEIPDAATRILFSRRTHEGSDDVPSLVLIVDDVRTSYEQLRARGIVFTKEPAEAPWNPGQTFALLRDSEGNTIMIGSG